MSPGPLRCPSCDHGNPEDANFCNQCGMPVCFEVCDACEAVNTRHVSRCYKCGGLLSKPAADPVASEPSPQKADEGPPPSSFVAYEGEPRLTRLPDASELAVDELQARSPSAAQASSRWLAVVIVAIAVLAVPAYLAYKDPAQVRHAIDSVRAYWSKATESGGPPAKVPIGTAPSVPARPANRPDAAKADSPTLAQPSEAAIPNR